jgi:hypothetical protein
MVLKMISASKSSLLFGVSLVAIIGVFLLDPIPQDLAYHNFADRRTFAGIPNLCDVLSNLPLLLVGFMGFLSLFNRRLQLDMELLPAVAVFFLGVVLTSAGSAYYHLQPGNATLVWDRLPMALAFMGLAAMVCGERVNLDFGRKALWPLLVVGFGSVLWWQHTEQIGQGDLRFYGLVQFLPMLILPLVLLLFPSRWSRGLGYWAVGCWYLLAKLLEFFDQAVFDLTGQVVSGHTLKHLAAAMAAWSLLKMLRSREPL